MTLNHSQTLESGRSHQEDAALKHQLRTMPDPQPSHGFDARLVDMLLREPEMLDESRRNQGGAMGGAIALEWLRGFFGSPWGLALAFGVLFAAAAMLGLQWFSPEEDLTKVDLLMLMSHELL